ncbi:MAG: hypothetical protein ACYC0E_13085, partial [Acidimicrobiales bacterium]
VAQVARHGWPALALLAAALGGVSYLAIASLGGAAEVWTEIAAVATSLGVSAAGIGKTASRLAASGARSLDAVDEREAKAWAVTVLPVSRLSPRAVRGVRRSGVPPGPRLVLRSPPPPTTAPTGPRGPIPPTRSPMR